MPLPHRRPGTTVVPSTIISGTGQPTDLDRFDIHYRHLFLRDGEHAELVGACRLGLTDRILAKYGPNGLYTTTLFRFKPAPLRELTPAIELGRASVQSSDQRHQACLFLLWRGIGEFNVRHPRDHKLFGPVSISRDYQQMSRDLISVICEPIRCTGIRRGW